MTDDPTEDVATPADETDEEVEVIASEIEQTRERDDRHGPGDRRAARSGEHRSGRQGDRARGDGRKGRTDDEQRNGNRSDTGSGILETIRQNPLPAAMAAIGIGLLVMNRSNGRSAYRADRYWEGGWRDADEYRTGYGTGSGMTERAGETLDQVGQKAGRVASDVRSTVGELPDQVGTTARDVGWNAQRALEDNPLAVGAAAFAIGAAIGMALPETEVERNVLGQATDRAIDTAQRTASEAVQQLETSNA